MNKIIIDNNILKNYKDEYLIINNNTITFLKNNNYQIEYLNSNNIKLNYIIKENINIELSIYSNNDNLILNNNYTIKKSSTLSIYKFTNNNKSNENITIYLNGIYSKVYYYSSTISSNNETYIIKVIHNNKYTSSYISNKCISLSGSNVYYQIDSIIPKGNISSIMDQNTNIIELGKSSSTIKPNMYIDENDVEARHGSTIGNINEEELFYLMSRGINRKESLKLLITGFLLSHLKQNKNLIDKIKDIINKNWR